MLAEIAIRQTNRKESAIAHVVSVAKAVPLRRSSCAKRRICGVCQHDNVETAECGSDLGGNVTGRQYLLIIDELPDRRQRTAASIIRQIAGDFV